ncbi:MAG: DNA-binding response regulator, partial [Saprospiraceae bacterium]|nr:DNA-binding response regulator [Saprospiraceae bacterium]
EHIPDLIVSDVMMPEKDGYELCATLKADERTSHIPIILLTAKADQRSKLEGLTQGADAYLAKPFQREELLVRMDNLIALRRQFQERFGQTGQLRLMGKARLQSPEEVFLQKVLQIIEANLADEDFGMPQLCREVHMSRSHLFRKLKALTGKSATHLIRSVRLEKGKELLETTDLTVAEIAYRVGFNNPSYFSKMFKEEFGEWPTDLRKP